MRLVALVVAHVFTADRTSEQTIRPRLGLAEEGFGTLRVEEVEARQGPHLLPGLDLVRADRARLREAGRADRLHRVAERNLLCVAATVAAPPGALERNAAASEGMVYVSPAPTVDIAWGILLLEAPDNFAKHGPKDTC